MILSFKTDEEATDILKRALSVIWATFTRQAILRARSYLSAFYHVNMRSAAR